MWSLKNLRVLIYPKLHETNSCDYMLLHEKIWLAFPLLRVTACPSSRLQMTTSTKIGQYFDGWILMDNNAVGGNLFTENWRLLSFYVSFHCRHGKKYNCDQDYFVLFCFVWVLVEESVATRNSLMAVFVVHASFYSRVSVTKNCIAWLAWLSRSFARVRSLFILGSCVSVPKAVYFVIFL